MLWSVVSLRCILYRVMFFFFFKQKTAYEMRMSDWSSDVCSSDLPEQALVAALHELAERTALAAPCQCHQLGVGQGGPGDCFGGGAIGHGKLLCHRSDAAARERFPPGRPAATCPMAGPVRVRWSRRSGRSGRGLWVRRDWPGRAAPGLA